MLSLLIKVILVFEALSQYKNYRCHRENITSQYDCEHYYEGQSYWNSTACLKNETTINPNTTETNKDPTYCNLISKTECANDFNCALINDNCLHFTGCSAFMKEKQEECQSISKRCVTNGKQCVEIGLCEEYLTEQACQYDEEGDYCYWDSSLQKCETADTCEQYPKFLNTDQLCREEQITCTVAQSGQGCVESNSKCSDQLFQNQCFWNRDKTQECFWNGTACVDKICQNALSSLITDEQCIKYLKKCTTKLNGGCVDRTTCNAATIKDACKTNAKGELCFWDGTKCLDKICSNAPSTYKTNSECESYLEDCITNGNGCVDNLTCDSAKLEDACESDLSNKECAWVNNLCVIAQCSLAPNTLTTNLECSKFLTGCVTRKDGGCMKISKCSDYDIEEACLIDLNGEECFWNDNDVCVDKTCENAPLTLEQHQDCQLYSDQCTINPKTNLGCVDMICENITAQQLCVTDLNDNKCFYQEKCSSKECTLANLTTALECNKYLSECTLNDEGNGCTLLPLTCRGNSKKESCYFRLDGLCGWNSQSNVCIDRECFTADASYNTNEQCNTYLKGCVVSNTAGCMVLPKLCEDRKKELNCHFDDDNCVWGSEQCQSRSCLTAQFELDTIDMAECKQYIECSQDETECCILNNEGNNCQGKSTCDVLDESNCVSDAAIEGTCVWNGAQCINADSLLCTDYIGQNHKECHDLKNTCTVNANKNGCIDLKECEQYDNQSQCVLNLRQQFCSWNAATSHCYSFSCSDAPDSFSYSTDEQCRVFQSDCTVHSDIGGCVDKFSTCGEYLKKESCYRTINSAKNNCYWYNNSCRKTESCADITFLQTFTTANCEQILYDCKVNTTNNGCVLKICTDYNYTTLDQCLSLNSCSINKSKTQCIPIKSECGDYTDQSQCYYSKDEGLCIPYIDACYIKNHACESMSGDETTCPTYRKACIKNPFSNNCKRNICSSVSSPDASLAQCQDFDIGCTAQVDLLQCTDIMVNCSDYTDINLCYYSNSGYCILDKDKCIDLQNKTPCNQLIFKYDATCDSLKNSCANNPDKTSAIQCVDKTCSNAIKSEYNHQICQEWMSDCTSNYDGTKCIVMQNNCSDYKDSDCGDQSISGGCKMKQNICVTGQCNYSPSTLLDNQACQSYLSTCTVDRIGGCEQRQKTCDLYKLQKQCYFDINNNRCFWNPTLQNCVELKCSNIEKTSQYSTTQQCKSIQYIDCILDNTGKGCQDNQYQCESITSQQLCTKDIKGQQCQWNDNKCYTQTCTTAPTTLTTLQQCLAYYTKVKCTTKSGGGCTFQLDYCENYTDQGSCIISKKGVECGYDEKEKKCKVKSCQIAPSSYSTHQQCNDYMDTCTVHTTGTGCQTIPDTCEEMTMIQCEVSDCYYDNDQSKCITKTCQNKPDSISSCSEYLGQCYEDTIKCKSAICEYYYYATDQECRNIMSHCTSDGTQCIPRRKCTQAFNEASCVSQPDGQLCQWTANKQCSVRSCSVAPKTLTTHSQCQSYLKNCTTQKNGGCINLMQCVEYSISEQCQIDTLQKPCVWDITKNWCRNQECQDQFGNNHKSCQAVSKECTADLVKKGYCMDLLECSEYTLKLHCIIGTDGSCLWVNNQCYQYSQCEDIQFKTHEECQKVSKECTTDGNQCVPITFCQETNTNGGCKLGIDGECIQIFKDDVNVCTQFESCKQIALPSHSQCYATKSDCTTDGVTCISLTDCNKYTLQISCLINIISTGQCAWDTSANQCRDQGCTDLAGTTNEACESQLYSCTSNGKTCVSKFNCSSLTNEAECKIAKSEDGQCFWLNSKCEVIGCANIANAKSVEKCREQNSKCTYDGQSCIAIGQCKDYKTQISCNSKGTDGICSWIPPASSNVTTTTERNVCKPMESCQQSEQDQNSCLQVKDLCYYKKATNTSSSQCLEHTCSSYYEQNNICQFFYNWNKTEITFCQIQNNTCIKIVDPTTLSYNDCYLLSGYTYTFNSQQSKCQSCQPPKKNITIDKKFANILTIFLIVQIIVFI
ncbi:unnamed protein product (macronuclear) [Paramecium tetraurelia]|uniref:PSI domain-containing protein n=1 Tax=Paramecium tetraurelia TaxID=5888 RepID=A0CC63_PARTE|nr:uncharacterized protein GSPATT00037164001 [Paramecium tetraurelia]CAK68380.1 unnamed protein product [Paramecium tetraurelia]|eukprot:XP_001435777.1 hypothetical protein (macronuclear) [Paramecium tetraurelia strain d4-2]